MRRYVSLMFLKICVTSLRSRPCTRNQTPARRLRHSTTIRGLSNLCNLSTATNPERPTLATASRSSCWFLLTQKIMHTSRLPNHFRASELRRVHGLQSVSDALSNLGKGGLTSFHTLQKWSPLCCICSACSKLLLRWRCL